MGGQEEEAKARFIYFAGPALGQIWIKGPLGIGVPEGPRPRPNFTLCLKIRSMQW